MNQTYKNKYGFLEFEVVSPYVAVSTILSKNVPEDLFFDIDQAEQIALITGNRGIQLCVSHDRKRMFLIKHSSPSQAALCRVTRVDFTPVVNAREVLARPQPYRGPI